MDGAVGVKFLDQMYAVLVAINDQLTTLNAALVTANGLLDDIKTNTGV